MKAAQDVYSVAFCMPDFTTYATAAMQRSAAQRSAAQHSTAQHSTAQHSMAWHSLAWLGIAWLGKHAEQVGAWNRLQAGFAT